MFYIVAFDLQIQKVDISNVCPNVHKPETTPNPVEKTRKTEDPSMLLRQMLLKWFFSGIEIVTIKKKYINFDNYLEKKCCISV